MNTPLNANAADSVVAPKIAERYPEDVELADGTKLTVTPMVPSDWQLMQRFLGDIPADDQQFLRDDISDPAIVERWCRELNYETILPLLAWDGSRIVADGTLHREPGLWTAHVGKIRLLVHPSYRRRGVATAMATRLTELARHVGLHQVVAECAAEQTELLALLTRLGFHEAARLPDFVRDRQGQLHAMVLMVHRLGQS